MMTRSSTEVMMATPKNILKRSAPTWSIFSSSSWLDTMEDGMTKPKATPSCQSRFSMHYLKAVGFWVTFHTWLPKTPIAHAEETWSEGNQVAANWGGIPKIKIWEMATILCPVNISGKRCRLVAKTLIHDPRQVPREPKSTDNLRP